MVKKSDKSAAKNAAQTAPAAQAGALSREAMADETLPSFDDAQANSAAQTAKYGDRARINGMDVWWDGDMWAPGSPPTKPAVETVKAAGWGSGLKDAIPDVGAHRHNAELGIDEVFNGQSWGPAPPKEVGWGLDGQQMSEAKPDKTKKPKKPTAAEKKAKAKADAAEAGVNLTGMAKDLTDGVERLERLAEERDALGEDMKEIFGELKQKGYSTAIIRKVIARRQMDPEKRKEQDDMLKLYEESIT